MRKLFAILMIGLLTIVGAQSLAASSVGPPGVSVEMTYTISPIETISVDFNSVEPVAIPYAAYIFDYAFSREVEYVFKGCNFGQSITLYTAYNTQPVTGYSMARLCVDQSFAYINI